MRTLIFQWEFSVFLKEGIFHYKSLIFKNISSLSLHDHPNMLVLTKVLYGSMHCRAMDLIDKSFQLSLPQSLFEKGDPRVIGKE